MLDKWVEERNNEEWKKLRDDSWYNYCQKEREKFQKAEKERIRKLEELENPVEQALESAEDEWLWYNEE